jgi:hypothetical protein
MPADDEGRMIWQGEVAAPLFPQGRTPPDANTLGNHVLPGVR